MPPLPTTGRASSVNVFRASANQLIGCNDVTEPVDAFLLFLSHRNINAMITFTNIEGKRQNPGKWIDTDDVEKKAFVGCLLFWGAKTKTKKQTNKKQQNMQSTEMLFDPLYGEGLVRSTITRKRFMQLLTNLHFDDKATRNAQRARDVFAPFRDFWEDCRSAFRNGTFLDHLSALMSSWYRSADVAHSCSTCHLYQIAMA